MVFIIIIAPEGKSMAASQSLSAAVAQMLAAKARAGLRPLYLASLRLYLAQFTRFAGADAPLATLDAALIDRWFAARAESRSAMRSNLGRLSALFAFAVRRGWLEENPCARVERVRIEHHTPAIFTVEQCRSLARHAEARRPDFLAWLVLALFAGIRPEEIGRLSWADVNLDAGTVTVDAAASKTHRRRIVHLVPAALAWLRRARAVGAVLPVARTTRRRRIRELRGVLGLAAWPQDVLRHSAASYFMAEFRDAARVADELGNSPKILLTHYRALVTPEAAREWFNIFPEDGQMELKMAV